MKIWHSYDGNQIKSLKDSDKIQCDNNNLFDVYHTLIDGKHIFLLRISMSQNWLKENDENLSELESKAQKSICTKMDLVISFSVLNHF